MRIILKSICTLEIINIVGKYIMHITSSTENFYWRNKLAEVKAANERRLRQSVACWIVITMFVHVSTTNEVVFVCPPLLAGIQSSNISMLTNREYPKHVKYGHCTWNARRDTLKYMLDPKKVSCEFVFFRVRFRACIILNLWQMKKHSSWKKFGYPCRGQFQFKLDISSYDLNIQNTNFRNMS